MARILEAMGTTGPRVTPTLQLGVIYEAADGLSRFITVNFCESNR